MWHMNGRRIRPELLEMADPEDARRNLRDIVILNQTFGGHAVARHLLNRVVRQHDRFSLLDVGAASGDIARLIGREYPNSQVFNIDRKTLHLQPAPQPKAAADAFSLPFAAASFDFVFCSLFLHHFRDDQVVYLLRCFASLAKKAVLITDLERHLLPYILFPATRWTHRWHWMTVHDGKASVRAAFTKEEIRTLGKRAGLSNINVQTHRPAFRLSLIGQAG
jgi:SAM-dependent methyltransferase